MAWFRPKARAARQSTGSTKGRDRMQFRPSLEQLETRAVPAVTVSLSAGLLTVNGSTGNDSIFVRESVGKVTVSGWTKSYSVGSVTSIRVNANKGNDLVSLVGLKATWDKPITVTSAAGTDTVRLLDGTTRQLKGTNQRLTIPAGGSSGGGGSTGGGGTGDWFDTNIQDAALRNYLRNEYADSGIDRNEIVGAFNQVQSDGTVSSTEFNDLTDVANNAWLFGSSSYLTDLTRNVVLGNTANAHFKGGALGNLTAGSAASKLDKLVDKWFFGADHPVASYPNLTVTYTTAQGSLFGAGGPQYTDVHQGATGDCYFVATLAEVAQESPSAITDMFIVNGDGTYGVRFFQNGNARYVTVDSMLPTYSGGWFLYANMGDHAGSSSNVLWVALAEKAYAQMNESGWLRQASWGGGQNSYEGIEGGMFSDATKQIANRTGFDYYVNGASDAAALNNAVTQHKLVGFASKGSPIDSRIVGNHQYIVVAYNHSTQTVTLFNPWGIDNGQAPGLVSLTLFQVDNNFDYWTIA